MKLFANTFRDIRVISRTAPCSTYLLRPFRWWCLQSIVPFSLWILPAILSFVAAWRPGTSHDTIHITLDRMLAGDMLHIGLRVSVSEHLWSHG